MEGKEGEKHKGPRGGVAHTPGRGHDTKSRLQKKKRFQKKAAKKRRKKAATLRKQWQEWDSLPSEVQKLRPEKKPKLARPKDENETTA